MYIRSHDSILSVYAPLSKSDTLWIMITYLRTIGPRMRGELGDAVLLRLDFNTKDDWRMMAVLPTIHALLKMGKKIVIVSHRGRPSGGSLIDGVPSGFPAPLHLKKDAATLAARIAHPVKFIGHFRWNEIRAAVRAAEPGSIFLLDNLRFLPGEAKNDAKLARSLASLADFYVNDAFAVSHRANASVVAITNFLPSFAGLELEREIAALGKVMARPGHPLVLILGGAKASGKLGVIAHFRRRADRFLLGGGSANSVLALRGVDVRKSLRETDPAVLAALRPLAKDAKVIAPEDLVWGKGAARDMALDIGPKSSRTFAKEIARARTIIWSGPLGMIEKDAYAKGSIAIARAIGRNRRAFSLTGGGETVMFLKRYGLDTKFSFVSTGGGAMLDFLAGEKLPGIEALSRRRRR
jgi:3-phosphoglycerate kinase